MSEEEEVTSSVELDPSIPEATEERQVSENSEQPKKSPKFIAVNDLQEIINILVHADKISPDEAVKRLNNMVAKGDLVIVPLIGTKRKV